jgi:hypothetical protein
MTEYTHNPIFGVRKDKITPQLTMDGNLTFLGLMQVANWQNGLLDNKDVFEKTEIRETITNADGEPEEKHCMNENCLHWEPLPWIDILNIKTNGVKELEEIKDKFKNYIINPLQNPLNRDDEPYFIQRTRSLFWKKVFEYLFRLSIFWFVGINASLLAIRSGEQFTADIDFPIDITLAPYTKHINEQSITDFETSQIQHINDDEGKLNHVGGNKKLDEIFQNIENNMLNKGPTGSTKGTTGGTKVGMTGGGLIDSYTDLQKWIESNIFNVKENQSREPAYYDTRAYDTFYKPKENFLMGIGINKDDTCGKGPDKKYGDKHIYEFADGSRPWGSRDNDMDVWYWGATFGRNYPPPGLSKWTGPGFGCGTRDYSHHTITQSLKIFNGFFQKIFSVIGKSGKGPLAIIALVHFLGILIVGGNMILPLRKTLYTISMLITLWAMGSYSFRCDNPNGVGFVSSAFCFGGIGFILSYMPLFGCGLGLLAWMIPSITSMMLLFGLPIFHTFSKMLFLFFGYFPTKFGKKWMQYVGRTNIRLIVFEISIAIMIAVWRYYPIYGALDVEGKPVGFIEDLVVNTGFGMGIPIGVFCYMAYKKYSGE